jgi:cell division protein FtsA
MRSPRFATVMGLLGEARMQRLRGRKFTQTSGSFKAILARMKEWFTQ